MSDSNAANPSGGAQISTVASYWHRIVTLAADLWHAIVTTEAEVQEVEKDHPEVLAAAAALEAMAPPEVRVGIDTAKEIAGVVNDMTTKMQAAEAAHA